MNSSFVRSRMAFTAARTFELDSIPSSAFHVNHGIHSSKNIRRRHAVYLVLASKGQNPIDVNDPGERRVGLEGLLEQPLHLSN